VTFSKTLPLKAYRLVAFAAAVFLFGAFNLAAQPLVIAEWGFYVFGTPTNQSDWLAVAAGESHSLALKSDGTVIAWGDDYYGQCEVPTNLTGVAAIAAGNTHSLALLTNGTVVGWGDDYNGQSSPPTNLTSVISIAAGVQHSLALKQDGTVASWGDNGYGQPVVPSGLSNVIAIAAGAAQSLALRSDGTVIAWNYDGQSTVPSNLTSVIAIAAGGPRGAALKSDGSLVTWGGDFIGGTPPPANVPGAVAVAINLDQGVILKSDGTLVSWGLSPAVLFSPSGLSGVVSLSAAGYHVVTLTAAPPPPTGLSAVVLATNQIQLFWNNSTGANGYYVERSLETWEADSTTWTLIGTTGVGQTNYSDTVPTTATNYWYRLRAFNDSGSSLTSDAIDVRILSPDPVLNGGLAGDSVYLVWGQDTYGFSSYNVERAPDINGAPGSWIHLASAPAVLFLNYFVDTNITSAGEYWYRVQGTNGVGSFHFSEPFPVFVTPPTIPQPFSNGSFADHANIFWSVNATEIEIDRAPDVDGNPGSWEVLTNVPSYPAYFPDSGLAANTTYWYHLRAFNWVGISDYSAPISVTIQPPATPEVNAYIASNGVDLTFAGRRGDEGGVVVERALDVGGVPGQWGEITTTNSLDTYNDTGVLPYSTYWYRARFFNVLGYSSNSTPVSIAILPPSIPFGIASSHFVDQISVGWFSPNDGMIGFKVECAPDLDGNGTTGAWVAIATIPPAPCYASAVISCTVTNRNANQLFLYRVRAFNWVGESDPSDMVGAAVELPVTPHSLTATIGDSNQVLLTWIDDSPDATGYIVEQADDLDGNPGPWRQLSPQDLVSRSCEFLQTNAVANSTNWYRVRAFNPVGLSGYSDPVSLSIVPPPFAPGLNVAPFKTTAVLKWGVNYDGPLEYFEIERAPDTGGNPGSWSQILTTNGSESHYEDTPLTGGIIFWYRMRAFNWVGASPFSNPISITFIPPAAPVRLSPSLRTFHLVLLQWDDVTYDQDGYRIERAPNINGQPGSWTEIGLEYATNMYSRYFNDTNVLPYTTNWYRIRSFNSLGLSGFCTPASVAVIPPLAPVIQTSVFKTQVVIDSFRWWADSSIDKFELQRAPDIAGNPGVWIDVTNTPWPAFIEINLPANTYWYRARVRNWVDYSPYCTPVSVTLAAPAPPQIQGAQLGSTNRATLNIFKFIADEDGFEIQRAPDTNGVAGPWSDISFISITNQNFATFTDTNVTRFTTNWYRVCAFNSLGSSSFSAPTNIAAIPPPTPYSINSYPQKDTIVLYWASPDLGLTGGFRVERTADVSGNPGAWSQIGVTDGSTKTYTDIHRATNTVYWYRTCAFNWVGDSSFSPLTSSVLVPPSQPSQLYAEPGNPHEINLSWVHGSSDADGFNVERSTNANNPVGWTEIGTLSVTNYFQVYFVDSNCIPNATNWYRVRAFNNIGISPYCSPASISVIPPVAPVWGNGIVTDPHKIDLFWAEYDLFITGYKIERAVDSGGTPGTWNQIANAQLGDSAPIFADTTVSPGREYWYRICAYNWAGDSPYSVALLVNNGASPRLISLELLDTDVLITWSAPGNTTNFVQAADTANGIFSNITPPVLTDVTSDRGSVTTYLDCGALTNAPTRFYRILRSP